MEFQIDDRLLLKKGHPCGANDWKVLRVGADIKIKCQNCGHLVMIPRSKLEKQVKKINPEPETGQN